MTPFNRILLLSGIIFFLCLFIPCKKAKGGDVIIVGDGKNYSRNKLYPKANFESEQFHSTAKFLDAKFNFLANFHHAKFDSLAYFEHANFDSLADFRDAHFFSFADFGLAKFNFSALFYGAQFDWVGCFRASEFDRDVNFTWTQFDTTADFTLAQFHSVADFSWVRFKSDALFYLTKFDSAVDFGAAVFNTKADFDGAQFLSHVDFRIHGLPDTLVFENINEINNEIDFTVAKLDTLKAKNKNYKCQICLLGSDISKIKINYELFKLWFPKGTSYEMAISTYEKLLKKFKDDGFLESYEMLDVEYQNFKNIHNGYNALNWFKKYWWNYGYNKEWVLLRWTLGLLFSFIILNFCFFPKLQQNVYEMTFSFYDKNDFEMCKKKNNFIWRYLLYVLMRLSNSFIYTSFLFFGLKLSPDNFKKLQPLTYYILAIYVVGLFCLAYILNIIIVK